MPKVGLGWCSIEEECLAQHQDVVASTEGILVNGNGMQVDVGVGASGLTGWATLPSKFQMGSSANQLNNNIRENALKTSISNQITINPFRNEIESAIFATQILTCYMLC